MIGRLACTHITRIEKTIFAFATILVVIALIFGRLV